MPPYKPIFTREPRLNFYWAHADRHKMPFFFFPLRRFFREYRPVKPNVHWQYPHFPRTWNLTSSISSVWLLEFGWGNENMKDNFSILIFGCGYWMVLRKCQFHRMVEWSFHPKNYGMVIPLNKGMGLWQNYLI